MSQITRLTDGQTDGQTEILIARPRLHCMQRGKNGTIMPYITLRISAIGKLMGIRSNV